MKRGRGIERSSEHLNICSARAAAFAGLLCSQIIALPPPPPVTTKTRPPICHTQDATEHPLSPTLVRRATSPMQHLTQPRGNPRSIRSWRLRLDLLSFLTRVSAASNSTGGHRKGGHCCLSCSVTCVKSGQVTCLGLDLIFYTLKFW